MIPAKHYKKIDKNSSLNNRRVDSSEDGFKNFSIYLDTVNIKSEMTNLGLEKYETLLLNAMNKAIETLQSLLKVKELSEDFLFSDEDMAQLQIPYWDTTKLGPSATKGIKSLGLDLTIMGYFEDFQDDSILAAAQPAINDPGTNRPIIGIVAINPKVNYSKLNSEKAFQTIFLHEFTHILGFVPETFQYLDFLGTETNNGITRHYLKSSKVVEVAKKYFNCNNLKGAYLEESDEEEQRRQKRRMLLEAMADGRLADVPAHELIAVLDHVDELAAGNQLQALACGEHHDEHDGEDQNRIQEVLGHAPTADVEDRNRREGVDQLGDMLSQGFENRFHVPFPFIQKA